MGCAVEIVIFFTLSKCGRGWLRNFAGGTGGFTVSVAGCLSSGGSGGAGAGAVRELAGKNARLAMYHLGIYCQQLLHTFERNVGEYVFVNATDP